MGPMYWSKPIPGSFLPADNLICISINMGVIHTYPFEAQNEKNTSKATDIGSGCFGNLELVKGSKVTCAE